jgi:hypothetical protein
VEIWSRSSGLEDIRRQNHAFSCSVPATITLLRESRKALDGANIEKRLEQVLPSNSRLLKSLGSRDLEIWTLSRKENLGGCPKVLLKDFF